METLDFITKEWNIDATQESPILIPYGRFKDLPKLLNKLDFKVGAEIGVHQGTYSKTLLQRIPGLKLYGIDLWKSYSGYKDFTKHNLSEAHQMAIDNTKAFDCELIQGWSDSKEILNRFADESLDFIFIDGNHAYEWVVWDIANWSKKVKKGGIIFGHDYDDYTNSKRWKEMGVIPAIDGWTKSYKIAPWFVLGNNRNRCFMWVN